MLRYHLTDETSLPTTCRLLRCLYAVVYDPIVQYLQLDDGR
uniref:Uncharacterized protein n=1 Tax=Arundo donax TaxID=35708 RepID=A0A0A8YD90_ARUDO